LIKVYQEDLDLEDRLDAMHRIDRIVHDEAFYIPFWGAPYIRLVHWDYLQFPEFYLPKRTQSLTDYLIFWIDPAKRVALDQAMEAGTPYPVDEELDRDHYGVRERFQ
jgi:microcin C transport system substrate-binding protein